MLAIAPNNDLVGIHEIRFVEKFTHPKSNHESLAHYLRGTNGKSAVINFHMPNILEHAIDQYYFEVHPEIAALLLSEILFHEIGHPVHYFKKHGIKKKKMEKFADKYAKAGYFNYLKSRKRKILNSYKLASFNFIDWNKEQRASFEANRQELIDWLKENSEGIGFP